MVLPGDAVKSRGERCDRSIVMSRPCFDDAPTRYGTERGSYLQNTSQAVHDCHGLKDGFIGNKIPFISAFGVL